MTRLSLDKYPHDILFEIFSIAGITNLTKLLNNTFIQSNPNIQQTVNNVITSKPIYKYDNATTPFKAKEFFIHLGRRTTDFITVEEAWAFADYCVENDIEVQLELSYLMVTILDWIELEELLKSLKPSRIVKIRLSINLAESKCILDLTKIPSLVSPIKEGLIGLSIQSGPLGSSTGALDLEYLRDIEVLQLGGCGIIGSFSQCHNLKELEYLASGEHNSIEISNLPPKLKRLYLYDCDDIKGVVNKSARFPSLESISLSYEGPELPSSVKDILQLMTCKETTCIEFNGENEDLGANESFMNLLYEVVKRKGFKLETLKIGGEFESKLKLFPSKRLFHSSMHDIPLELPPTMRELRLERGTFTSTEISRFPTSLVKLHLVSADIDSNLNFTSYANMKNLSLEYCDIVHYIHSFTFPESLEELDLSGTGIESVDKIKLPRKLKRLVLASNRLQDISNSQIPPSLKELDISGNELKKIQLAYNVFGEPLQIDLLDIRDNKPGLLLSSCEFPNTLQYLAIEYFYADRAYKFNLSILKSRKCYWQSQCLTFGSHLKVINLSSCRLGYLNMVLPQSLEEIDLSRNKLTEIPVLLSYLQNLKLLNLSHNRIFYAHLTLPSQSLEVLNLSNNNMEEIQLTFPKSVTNLRSVDLSGNQLSMFSMGSIGHNGGTLHSNLQELDVSGNKFFTDAVVASLKPKLPKSARYFWANHLSVEQGFDGSRISNELPYGIFSQKTVYFGNRMMGSLDEEDSSSESDSDSSSSSDSSESSESSDASDASDASDSSESSESSDSSDSSDASDSSDSQAQTSFENTTLGGITQTQNEVDAASHNHTEFSDTDSDNRDAKRARLV
ncbi:hypothetical protein I9W82_001509 [Candida metapsilosis]|uniref:Uncharacterized protein n=1 Tax=Candida metapsilosis TaxID=273372 RepID=A0A8H8DBA7_9ASCO|nr:hypothetical protein I9W82_001509 [Candida metapsilosis]